MQLDLHNDKDIFGDYQLFELPISESKSISSSLSESSLRITFNTQNGEILYKGVPPKGADRGKVGLTKADDILHKVYEAIRQDDPFADQLLYDMHQSMIALEETCERANEIIRKNYQEKMRDGVSMKIEKSKNTPFDVRLKTNFCRGLLWKIKQVDDLTMMNLAGRYREILDVKTSQQINKALMSTAWNILYLVFHWKATGVTRQDVIENNKRFEQAANINSKILLTEGVLNRSERSTYAPEILIKPQDDIVPLIDKETQKSETAKAFSEAPKISA